MLTSKIDRNQVLQAMLQHLVTKSAIGSGAPTNVAHANEQNRKGFHGGQGFVELGTTAVSWSASNGTMNPLMSHFPFSHSW
jgi:hypothetical protein